MFKALVLGLGFAVSASQLNAATITIGTPHSSFPIPFTPAAITYPPAPERHQQIWDAHIFAGLGRIEIQRVSFLLATDRPRQHEGGMAQYDFSLSTSARDLFDLVSSEEPFEYDANLGSDNALFGSIRYNNEIVTEAPSVTGSFIYDPSAGDLLLDIAVSEDPNVFSAGISVAADFLGGSGTAFSVAGSQFERYGPVVTFEYEPISEDETLTPVPLPASFGFLLAGLGCLGLASRRAKKA
jgi:hypothetical protein